MSEEAKKYFTLRRQEEIQRLERRMQAERRRAELEEVEHAKLLKERNLEAPPTRNRAVAAPIAPVAPVVTPAAPSLTIPDSAAAGEQEDSGWEDTECIPDTPTNAGDSQPDQSFEGSQDTGFAGPSQGRNFRPGFSVEMLHPDYVCSVPSAFGQTNVMYGVHSAGVSPIQGAFTENDMRGYRNGGPSFNLNAQFY